MLFCLVKKYVVYKMQLMYANINFVQIYKVQNKNWIILKMTPIHISYSIFILLWGSVVLRYVQRLHLPNKTKKQKKESKHISWRYTYYLHTTTVTQKCYLKLLSGQYFY